MLIYPFPLKLISGYTHVSENLGKFLNYTLGQGCRMLINCSSIFYLKIFIKINHGGYIVNVKNSN